MGNNIHIIPEVIERESVEWIDLAQDRGRWWVLVHAVMNSLVR